MRKSWIACAVTLALVSCSPEAAPLQSRAEAVVDDDADWLSTNVGETSSLAWGDWDGDGDLDLAVGRVEGPTLVYSNEAGALVHDPAAGIGWTSPNAYSTWDVAWGDFDGDGDLDLAEGNIGELFDLDGDPDFVYLNDGAGGLTQLWQSPGNESTNAVGFGDLDGDGSPELAIVAAFAPPRVYEYDASGGTFDEVWVSATDDVEFTDLAWGDVDNDGDPDLATVAWGDHARVFLNAGGTLPSVANWTSSSASTAVAVAWGDLDGDGYLDLVAANEEEGIAQAWMNDGGVLETSPSWAGGGLDDGVSDLALGDEDGDGDLDLVVTSWTSHDRLFVNGGGGLATTPTTDFEPAEPDQSSAAAWADADGDGDLDLAIGKFSGPWGDPIADRLFENNGVGLAPDVSFSTEEFAHDVLWGDADGDGDLDLAVICGGYNRVYANAGGVVDDDAEWVIAESDSSRDGDWGDFDGDGDLDLAVANIYETGNVVYENTGSAFVAAWTSSETDESFGVAWGDVDGDGDLDLAVANGDSPGIPSGTTKLYRNDGGGAFVLDWESADVRDSHGIAWGDVDGDGDLDLAVANTLDPNVVYENAGGTLSTTPSWESVEEHRSYALAWGDVDGDGDLDLAFGNGSEQTPEANTLYLNNGGTLAPTASWTASVEDSTAAVAWGDWDGDGDLDLAAGNVEFHDPLPDDGDPATDDWIEVPQPNRVYLNTGAALDPDPAWATDEGEATRGLAWADFDGDGDLDLATADSSQFDPNRIYVNHRIGPANLAQNPTRVRVGFVGADPPAAAGFAHASALVGASVAVELILADPESDPVPGAAVSLEYSLHGGGLWLPAAIVGSLPDELATAPAGVSHLVTWDTSGIAGFSDSVVVRARVAWQAPRRVGGPLHTSEVTAVSAPVRFYRDCFPFDTDGDGVGCADDCDEADAGVHPGATELCDAIDQDCDGDLVEGFGDADVDGTPDCADADADGDGHVDVEEGGDDCDDGDPTVFPGAEEECDGIDNDCDGDSSDPGDDLDGDGIADCNDDDADGDGHVDAAVDGGDDCDDTDPTVFPGADEICDGVDADCAGDLDLETDDDLDGFSECDGDCNDAGGAIHPDAVEICNGLDDDCDPETDETVDNDHDGYSECSPEPDCNDDDVGMAPDVEEWCDRDTHLDNDCDPATDELVDRDGDGFSLCGFDCDDDDPTIFNGALDELCDGVDGDCDGVLDDELDDDGDGVADCEGDCDDGDPTVTPNAAEVCDDAGIDHDCDGLEATAEGDNDCWATGTGCDGCNALPGDPGDTGPWGLALVFGALLGVRRVRPRTSPR